jgi:hypothetical protein
MVLVDARVHSKHVQVVRSDIEPDRSRNVEMLKVGWFEKKKVRAYPQALFSTTAMFSWGWKQHFVAYFITKVNSKHLGVSKYIFFYINIGLKSTLILNEHQFCNHRQPIIFILLKHGVRHLTDRQSCLTIITLKKILIQFPFPGTYHKHVEPSSKQG